MIKDFTFPTAYYLNHMVIPSLSEIDNFKRQKGQIIEKYFSQEKEKLLKMEKKALKNTPRYELYHQMLTKEPKSVNINQKSDSELLYKSKIGKNIKDIVLSGQWMK